MLRSHKRASQSPVPEGPRTAQLSQDLSNASRASELTGSECLSGPFDSPVLNAALGEAFQTPLGTLEATWASHDCDDLAAQAMTEDRAMTFSLDVGTDPADEASMEVVGEEVAHALAGGGTGETLVDAVDDPGEARAKDAGARFAAWARDEFRGQAPSLSPATGGRASVHRHASATLTGSPALRLGSQGASVRLLQSLLNQHGQQATVDGDFGPQTDGAVRRFQLAMGLVVDGVVGPQTARALNRPTSAGSPTSGLTGSPSLRTGSQGSAVRLCQERLNAHGDRVTMDGNFGRQTDGAVRRFQAAKGLTVDGVVGPITAAALMAHPTQAPAPSTTPTPAPTGSTALTGSPALRRGAQGAQVRTLQQALTAAGFRCVIDGDFGSQTERQVRAYQASRALVVDGVVGPQTATALTEERPAVQSSSPSGPAQAADYDPANRLAHANCSPGNRRAAMQTAERLTAQGYQPYVVSVVRTFSEQDALYAQGRTAPGMRVTGVRGGGSWHNYGCAVDFAFWNDRHTAPSWESHHPWHLIGECGLQSGYTKWGGNWGDRPHLELHPNYSYSAYNLVSLYQSHGLGSVWDRVGAN
jgi:peptidoglycan hydrolase-like protein with peptidoglycan-binding domain